MSQEWNELRNTGEMSDMEILTLYCVQMMEKHPRTKVFRVEDPDDDTIATILDYKLTESEMFELRALFPRHSVRYSCKRESWVLEFRLRRSA